MTIPYWLITTFFYVVEFEWQGQKESNSAFRFLYLLHIPANAYNTYFFEYVLPAV